MTVIDGEAAVSIEHGARVVVRTPARARLGLHLLAVVTWPGALTAPDFAAAGWDVLGSDDHISLLRRAIAEAEPATYEFAFDGELAAATDPPAMAALLVVTGVLDAGDASSFVAEDLAAAGPDLTASDAAGVRYDDGAFSVFAAAADDGFEDDDKAVVAIAGNDSLADTTPVPGSLTVWFECPETAGPVGDRTATLSGGAPCIALVAQATVLATPPARPQRWESDLVTIGLPRVGV